MLTHAQKAFAFTIRDLRKNWLLFPAALLIFIADRWAHELIRADSNQLLPVVSIIGGIVQIVLASLFLQNLEKTFDGDTLRGSDFVQFNIEFFHRLLGAAFLLYIGLYILEVFSRGLGNPYLSIAPYILAIVAFNPIPEILIVKKLDSFEALKDALSFLREHALAWIPIVLLGFAPLLLVSWSYSLSLLASMDVFSPFIYIAAGYGLLAEGGTALILLSVGVCLGTCLSVFRMHYYSLLIRH